jgi:hypothetical protein
MMRPRSLPRRRIRYAYEMCPMLERQQCWAIDLRCQYPSQIAKYLLQAFLTDYNTFKRTGSTKDRLRAWRALRTAHAWFCQLTEGNRHGLS